jgi:glyoxylase-like metal-dependent hydrolase (beta-lactamase superfamily II)
VRAWGDAPAGTTAVAPLTDGESLEVGGAKLEVIYTPGHASDHVAFFLAGAASLFAGDAVLGQGTAVIAPPDGDMAAYLASLTRLGERHISRIYPGHFAPLDGGNAVIEHYIEHRAQRQAAIVDALRSGAETVESIVEAVYTDTPQALHPVARYSVLAVLEMLEEQGAVLRTDNNRAWAVVD